MSDKKKVVEIDGTAYSYTGDAHHFIRDRRERGLFTALEWDKQNRVPKDGVEGLPMWYNRDKWTTVYSKSQTRAMRKREITARNVKRNANNREYRRKLRARNDLKLVEDFKASYHTSWQWLFYYGCIPIAEAESISRTYIGHHWENHEDEHGFNRWYKVDDDSASTWKYYKGEDVILIPKYWQGYLRRDYEEKFGGWETIDLEHTTYDGHAWWNYKALEQAAGSDIDLHNKHIFTAKEIRKLGA